MDCEGGCVCVSCVVHGVHRSHNVLEIDRAYPVIADKIDQLHELILGRIEDISTLEARIHAHRQEVVANTDAIVESMQQSFEEVRERLRLKEEELVQRAKDFRDEQVAQLDGYIRSAREKIEVVDLASEVQIQQ
jgi:hypothetical protein